MPNDIEPQAAVPVAVLTHSDQILTESIWKLMYRLSVPATIGMTLFGLNNLIDAVYIGQLLGENALAGASLIVPLSQIMFACAGLIGTGVASVLSRAIGEKNITCQERIFANMTFLSAIISVLIYVFSYFLTDDLLIFLGGKGEILSISHEYFTALMTGVFFSIWGFSANMMIRSEGKMSLAMSMAVVSVLTNIILTPLFIKLLGISGAAYATNISWLVYSGLSVGYYFLKQSSTAVNLRIWTWDLGLIKEIISVGLSAMFMSLAQLLQQAFVFKTIAENGNAADLAFVGAVNRVLIFSILPVYGLVRSLQPMVGINYGSQKLLRVSEIMRIFILTGTALACFLCLPMIFAPEVIMRIMLPEANFTAEDWCNFRIFILSLPLNPLILLVITFYQSVGNGKTASWLTLTRQVLLFLPLTYFLFQYFGIMGVYLGTTLTDLLILVLCGLMYYAQTRKWQETKI